MPPVQLLWTHPPKVQEEQTRMSSVGRKSNLQSPPSIYALSALTKMNRLLFSIVFIPVCLRILKRRLNPDAKIVNVVLKLGINRWVESCSRITTIDSLDELSLPALTVLIISDKDCDKSHKTSQSIPDHVCRIGRDGLAMVSYYFSC
jgi:hypothetical protein